MTRRAPSLFEDLVGLETSKVEAMYSDALEEVKTVDAKLVDLQIKKKIHSETIRFPTRFPAQRGSGTYRQLIACHQQNQFDLRLANRTVGSAVECSSPSCGQHAFRFLTN